MYQSGHIFHPPGEQSQAYWHKLWVLAMHFLYGEARIKCNSLLFMEVHLCLDQRWNPLVTGVTMSIDICFVERRHDDMVGVTSDCHNDCACFASPDFMNIKELSPDWWAPKDVSLHICSSVCVGLEGFDDLESEVQEIQNWQTRWFALKKMGL